MNIIIDVGANEGSFLRQYLNDENNMIFAFEPVPHLYEKLKSLELNYKNIKVFNYAINIAVVFAILIFYMKYKKK